jgi:carbonic anhydrase
MDARLDAAGFLTHQPAPAHIVRNAGGRASADALRSLAVSCATGTERILVIHHTQCAMAEHTEEQLRALLPEGAEPGLDFLTIADPEKTLRQDVQAIKSSSLLPSGIEVTGFIYELDARALLDI